MVFSSLIFLFAYLPVTLGIYYLCPRRMRNLVLFLCSLFFYGWGEPIYILLMMLSVTISYAFGFLIEKYRENDPKRAKQMMIFSVICTLSLLAFFKYYNFFALNLSRIPFVNIPVIEGLKLPIGISFYTFQIMSYTIDLWRGDCRLQKNYVAFGTYVTLFPQLIAGPIVRYRDVDAELQSRRETLDDISSGITRFCVGLAKKILIGDALAAGCEYFKAAAELTQTALGAWAIVLLYTLHLYYDFSGYSDMAIGLGRMLGFHFPENFNYPYISKSISEFWRRWHISLSTWFREYVYIPLGGNRKGKRKLYRNLAVVWLLTGFWHGANWNFIIWGCYFAAILIIERAFLLGFLQKLPAVFSHIYTILLILIGFLIFSYSDLAMGLAVLGQMFGVGAAPVTATAAYALLGFVPLILIASVGATPLPKRLAEKCLEQVPRMELLRPVFCLLILALCTAYMVDSTFSPFAYFNF